jgi:phenylpropionate dioxygenase-like ring-hydroxylating dioxygenase large terminal subunit
MHPLVDAENGTISREIFVNPDIYAEEQERIFARSWLFVGHESLIAKPGDFITSRMGEESVVVTRGRQGGVHVLLNSCMHRGMKVCRYDQGNTRLFTCPYHGWSYGIDGKLVERPGQLVGVPGFEQHYHGELDRAAWGLKAVGRVALYKGTIWANWDAGAPDFLDWLGGMRACLDFALDHRDGSAGGSEAIGGIQKWRLNTNWKIVAENFIGDLYHDISHRSVDLVGIGPSGGKGRRDAQRPRMQIGFPGLGHGGLGETPHNSEPDYAPAWALYPEVEAYYRELHERRVRNLGDRARVTMSVGTIFPNTSFHGRQPRTILMAHPCGPTQTEMWRIYLVDADAPEAVKDAARHYYLRYSGPAGMTEQDDMENWTYATEASKGVIARRLHYNYQMGLGHARPVPGLPGAVQNGPMAEENQRIFYGRWAQFMMQPGWDGMMPAPKRALEDAD